jgi:hypothetical protein
LGQLLSAMACFAPQRECETPMVPSPPLFALSGSLLAQPAGYNLPWTDTELQTPSKQSQVSQEQHPSAPMVTSTWEPARSWLSSPHLHAMHRSSDTLFTAPATAPATAQAAAAAALHHPPDHTCSQSAGAASRLGNRTQPALILRDAAAQQHTAVWSAPLPAKGPATAAAAAHLSAFSSDLSASRSTAQDAAAGPPPPPGAPQYNHPLPA